MTSISNLASEEEIDDRKLVYIAGPMRGKPEFNFEAFMDAEATLKEPGKFPATNYRFHNPAAIDAEQGFDPKTGTPPDGMTFEEYLLRCIDISVRGAMEADAMVLLPDWHISKGARAEAAIAEFRGIPIYTLVDGDLYRNDDGSPYQVPEKRKPFLEQVENITAKDRQRDYGDPKDNLGQIAAMFTSYLMRKLKPGERVTGRDVGWLNILQKASRDSNRPKDDNFIDAAGYSRITEEAFPAKR